MTNKYNKPWRVEYETHDWRGDLLLEPHNVLYILDCNNEVVIETDCRTYEPNDEKAEYIVKCVNEKEDD